MAEENCSPCDYQEAERQRGRVQVQGTLFKVTLPLRPYLLRVLSAMNLLILGAEVLNISIYTDIYRYILWQYLGVEFKA
jgi:hypothetical protein